HHHHHHPNLVAELKSDLQTPHLRHFFQKIYMQKYDKVSILFGDVIGLNLLSRQCSALEMVRFLNETFGRFDQLASENYCSRIQIRGDRYFCLCGHQQPPQQQQLQQHAKYAVDMGIDMIEYINFVSNLTCVKLGMRVGVHSGSIVCGVVGLKRWTYDAWSSDVIVAGLTEQAGKMGRVLVTEATLKGLHGHYSVEP
ncbi:hypothetical protein HELRODRAFT_134305, partial [Helobdella robusta]|uniref:adenylate cyclase n=1 Tax=Helobdella robusta TaxID=6412 RepID=T1EI42_HELRO